MASRLEWALAMSELERTESRAPEAIHEPTEITDADVDEALAVCGGDMRTTIKALLIGQQYLEIALEMARQEASWGYVRGSPSRKLQKAAGG